MNPSQVKILIVEDESFIADLYAHILQKAGYQVKKAPDGQTALNMLSQEQFTITLLDIMMPGMNGLEVLRQWKLKNTQSQMIVILLTNLGQDAVIKEGFELGAQGYLIKASMTPDQVVTEVANALKNLQTQPVAPGTPPTSPPPTPTIPPQATPPTIPNENKDQK